MSKRTSWTRKGFFYKFDFRKLFCIFFVHYIWMIRWIFCRTLMNGNVGCLKENDFCRGMEFFQIIQEHTTVQQKFGKVWALELLLNSSMGVLEVENKSKFSNCFNQNNSCLSMFVILSSCMKRHVLLELRTIFVFFERDKIPLNSK